MDYGGSPTYFSVFKRIIRQTILDSPLVLSVAITAAILTISSTYFTVKTADGILKITKTFKGDGFDESLMVFLSVATIALVLKYIPRFLYTYILQELCREKFVFYLKEYLLLDFVTFHKRTPGEIRYTIFTKSYAAPLCSNLVIFEGSTLVGSVIFSFINVHTRINLYSAAVFLIVPVVYFLAVVFYIEIKVVYQNHYLEEQQNTSSKLYDKLVNYEIIKAYGLENSQADSLYKIIGQQVEAQVNMGTFEAKGKYLLNYLLIFPYALIIVISMFQQFSMSSFDIFKITILYTALTSQLKRIGNELDYLVMLLNQIRYTDVQASPPSREDRTILGFNSTIEFRNFSIYYEDRAIASNINVIVRKGEKIAIVGKNGTGKSTFIKSMLGFTRFTGELLIDSISTDEVSWRSVRKLISYIPQDDYTSDDTILNNLRLGRPDASRAAIEERAREFGVHETFAAFENGYDTEIGPRGNKLSNGQRQKISLLRAVLKDAPIFIMDEATASMDKGIEKKLISQIFSLLEDKTILMIVHGFDYLHKFDRIFFLNNGQLEVAGSLEENAKNSKAFREFIRGR